MARGAEGGGLLLHEDLGDVVSVLLHAGQELGLARCPGVGHGGLHEVAGTVQLVPVAVLPAVLGLDDGEEDVKVAVLSLVGGDILHDLVHASLQGGVGVLFQDVGRALHPLGYVTVPEEVGLDGILLGESEFERADTARLGKAVVHGVDGGRTVQLLLVKEKAASEVNLAMGNEFHNGTSFVVGAYIVQ